jgi:glycosyltransferase involved in cell wall biosynthesis
MAEAGHDNFTWVILGQAAPNDSGYYESFFWYLEKLGLHQKIESVGWTPNAQAWFKESDVVVLPTVAYETVDLGDGRSYQAICTEGLPRVVLEAMAAGCAVIATEVAGVKELIEHDISGLVIPPSNPGALSGALLRLQHDAELRHAFGAAAQEASQELTPARSARQILPIYYYLLASYGKQDTRR